MAKLPARLNDKVINSAHGDGLIVTADPSVLFEGQPAACAGHSALFADATPGIIQEGNACVTVNGKRVALLADTISGSGIVAESATSIHVDEGTPFVHLGPNVFIGKNVSFNTLKSPEGKAKPPLMDVQLFHYDGCEQQEPIANAYYKLTSFAGPTFSGRLDANGRATVAQVPNIAYKVNFSSYDAAGTDSQQVEQLKEQLQQQRAALKSILDQIIKKLTAAEKDKQLEFQHARLCNKVFKLIAATGETGYHIMRDVAVQTGEMLQAITYTTVDLTNQMMDIAVDLGETLFTGSTTQLNTDLNAMGQANRETIQVAEADAHVFWWLMRDKETWSILEDFAHRHWQALSTESKTSEIEYTPAMLAIVLATDGEALPGALTAAKEVTQATQELKKTAEAIHRVDVAVEEIGQTEKLEKMRPRVITPPPATPFLPLTPALKDAFKDGASALIPEDLYKKFYLDDDTFGRLSGVVVTTKAAMDELLARANGDISIIEKELGTKNWAGKTLYRIDIDNPLQYNPRQVTQEMEAANEHYLPGKNKTVGGQPEIAIDQIDDVRSNPHLSANKVIANGVSLPLPPSSRPILVPITKEPMTQE